MNFDDLYSMLYLEVNLFSIVLVVIIAIKTMGMTKMVAQRNFIRGAICLIVFFASDTFWVLMENRFFPVYSEIAIIASKNIYFLFTSLTCYSWFIYFEYLQDSPFVKDKKKILISATFVFIQFVLIILNHFTGILYYVNDKQEYTRGPLFLSLYAFSYIYVAVTCTRAFLGVFDKKKEEQRKKLIRLAAFPVAPAIGGVIQFAFPRLPLVCVMLALSVMILYIDWLTEMISVDPLTRLNNRKQLLHNYEQWLRNNEDHTPIYLLMIDADHFKEINDTYGHVEGDAALVRIADALRAACKTFKKRATIARYGGDEFVVLARAENDRIIKEFIENVNFQLDELNKQAGAKYELKVCIGMARTDSVEDRPIKELLAAADEKFYDPNRTRSKDPEN